MVGFFVIWFIVNLVAIFGGGMAVHSSGEFMPGGIFCVSGIVSMIIELACLGLGAGDFDFDLGSFD